MDEKSKGISLRKKRSARPTISAPKQISAPLPAGISAGQSIQSRPAANSSGLPSGPRPRERPQNGDRTADLVKRRYSTRFAQLPQDYGAGAPPMPAMPSMPSQFAVQPPSRDGQKSSGQKIKVDTKSLRDPSLQPEKCTLPNLIATCKLYLTHCVDVASLLSDASEEDIQHFQQDLRKVKNRTSTDLQQNVFQNRTQFIKISKEAEKLKSEMRTLRNLMSELTAGLGQATSSAGGGADTVAARRQANRSSVANLEALWNTHLQTLWKRVEGSQKYLPAIPGRHIVYESGRWVELNAATWKPRRRIHLILLNDHLLVAAEKKRTDAQVNVRDAKEKQGPTQLFAVRCWPLQDVQMADLATRSTPGAAERATSSNAVNIRVGTDSYTFATGSQEVNEKTALLSNFRKTAEDLRRTLEVETQDREKASDSVTYLAARDTSLLRSPGLVDSLAEIASPRTDLLIDVDGKPQSIRWVEAQIDDLDIDIALQRFEEAVARVEKLRRIAKGIKGNQLAQNIVNVKLNDRASKLGTVILRYLGDSHSWMNSTKKNVEWLSGLGFEDRAREVYLDARSQILRKRIRYVSPLISRSRTRKAKSLPGNVSSTATSTSTYTKSPSSTSPSSKTRRSSFKPVFLL